MNDPHQPSFDSKALIRRALFFVILAALTWTHIMPLFRGLDSPQAMDQAQLGRQIARGEGFHTKFIRPLELHLAESKDDTTVPITGLRDTYHAPLNPLVLGAIFKLTGVDDYENFRMEEKALVYNPDRIVALTSTIFFLMAIGVTYLLVNRVFDSTIAGITVLLMIFCNMFWQFSQSGLPQMLLLLLFSCALYFSYRSLENQEEGKSPLIQALFASIFFALMVLTHWIATWVFFGFLLWTAIRLRPRGLIALSSLVVLILAVAWPVIRMISASGQPFGVARFVFYNGLAAGSESTVMRTSDLAETPLAIDGLIVKILGTTLVQFSDIIPLLGGILAAPVFFIALLHPFKRKPIADFRWAILLMWFFAALGMAIFGVKSSSIHPNQIHLLFAPIMAAYGLAMVSILWSRLDFVATTPALRHAHYWIIVIISAAPMMLTLPKNVRNYIYFSDRGGIPQWPPYLPHTLNRNLAEWVEKDPENPEVIVSDQPWAVAWYADAYSIWLPRTMESFLNLDRKASDMGTPLAGIHITPSSRGDSSQSSSTDEFSDFAPLVLDGQVTAITGPETNRPGFSIFDKSATISEIANRFPYRYPLHGFQIMYYSANPLKPHNAR